MKNEVIDSYASYLEWLERFDDWNEEQWVHPISEGKWAAREIVSHIMFWDRYLLETSIEQAMNQKDLSFPDFEPFNQEAAEYARSGMNKAQLLDEAKKSRKKVIDRLLELPDDVLLCHLTSNGVDKCPHTGEPYSLLYIISDFCWHDRHHQKQIPDLAIN